MDERKYEQDNEKVEEIKYEIITDEEIREKRREMYEDEEMGMWY